MQWRTKGDMGPLCTNKGANSEQLVVAEASEARIHAMPTAEIAREKARRYGEAQPYVISPVDTVIEPPTSPG